MRKGVRGPGGDGDLVVGVRAGGGQGRQRLVLRLLQDVHRERGSAGSGKHTHFKIILRLCYKCAVL